MCLILSISSVTGMSLCSIIMHESFTVLFNLFCSPWTLFCVLTWMLRRLSISKSSSMVISASSCWRSFIRAWMYCSMNSAFSNFIFSVISSSHSRVCKCWGIINYALCVKGMLLTYSHVLLYVLKVNWMPGQFNINRGWPSFIKKMLLQYSVLLFAIYTLLLAGRNLLAFILVLDREVSDLMASPSQL